MKNIYTDTTAVNQSRIVMPTYAFGVSTCARVDAPARQHAAALIEGAAQGTTVWSPPPN
ncbi:hypothetical protein ncot_14160 [Nocardioides sp. JQ2195]|uniref:hypothetical protein n=1 Tax=Nocardioides sp. JQ2195 TaxID=2592334 RepID=UPI00143E441E|nr:hypothetical protein [Nocardioides sp. JQ2195]QIX27615.1 hypothetical protein ncot_14160 [Nocardioides sp. JQ2195]